DILPLDGYPASASGRRMQMVWAYLFSLFCAQSVPVRHGGLMASGARILLSLFKGKGIRYRIWRLAERKMSQTAFSATGSVTELCAGPSYMKNRYPLTAFTSAREVPFENQLAPIPIGAETYLGIAFGDFMQLPPVDKREPQHAPAFLDLETPYREYRGIEYYC
ncbi:MAG: 2-C-methyl-D-erythritol 4-phosphate cytidylyltransferase, partial [Coriobacteriaceae bacterium]|nr:2-C-methyl-D-erythritol 4-phosphate cytidylyltransferase [Coriobacteriaceae bacterium]